MGTPEATYEGMFEPSSERIPPMSPARSLIIPLRDLYVLVGSHEAGEGVIRGCSCATGTGLGLSRRTADAATNGRRASTKEY